jgi:hypothetical protein
MNKQIVIQTIILCYARNTKERCCVLAEEYLDGISAAVIFAHIINVSAYKLGTAESRECQTEREGNVTKLQSLKSI